MTFLSRRWLLIVGAAAFAALGGCGGAPPTQVGAPSAARPVESKPTAPLTSDTIDGLMRAEWSKEGVTPSTRADDATFLRRVYLDVVGVIPPAEKVRAFLADPAPSQAKRAKVVSELLSSKAYADYWTGVWEDSLLGAARAGDLDRPVFRVWLHEQFEKNVPWNKLVYELITATGEQSPGQHGRSTADTKAALATRPEVVGAVNYVLRFRDTPQDFAGSAAKTFLGTQIQCAQCHDHKTEKWTQKEFESFASSFTRVVTEPVGNRNGAGPRIVSIRDVDRPSARYLKNPDLRAIAEAKPTALDGTALTGNTRQGVARWMVTSPSFSRAIVNRMWGHFLGRGFTNPVDDMRPSNVVDAPAILERLARDFSDTGHDLKRLITLIATSEVYGLSASPPANVAANTPVTAGQIPLWSRFRPSPLGPDAIVSSVIAATGVQDALTKRGEDLDDLRQKLTKSFAFVFDVDEEFDQSKYEATLAQALVLMNGKLTVASSRAAALARQEPGDAAKLDALFLQTLARSPSPDERTSLLAYLASPPPPGESTAARQSMPVTKPKKKPGKVTADPLRRLNGTPTDGDPKVAALEDIQWALLNSSEFTSNH